MYLSVCLVWLSSLGVLPALFHFASIRFYSVMSLDEPISSGVGPEVQEAIKEAISGLLTNLTSVIESRLSGFKRDLIEERDSSVAFMV